MPCAESQRTPSVRTNHGLGGAPALRGITAYAERTYEVLFRRCTYLAQNHSVRRAYVRIVDSAVERLYVGRRQYGVERL